MFSVNYQQYKHCVGEASYHFQFTPKYRRKVFNDKLVKTSVANTMRYIASKLGVELHAIEFGPDHCHLFVGNCRKYSVSELARRFKGASSRYLRYQLWDRLHDKGLGDSFWTDGYFYESVGKVTNANIKFYIERQQRKHWKKSIPNQAYTQKSLEDFNN